MVIHTLRRLKALWRENQRVPPEQAWHNSVSDVVGRNLEQTPDCGRRPSALTSEDEKEKNEEREIKIQTKRGVESEWAAVGTICYDLYINHP